VSKDCWECGPTVRILKLLFNIDMMLICVQCGSCKRHTQRTCQSCRGDYCIEHNEGCSATMVSLELQNQHLIHHFDTKANISN
jgi:hypothetical protein